MLNHDESTALRKAEQLCDEATSIYVNEPKEALAMLLNAETLLNGHRADETTYDKVLSRCLSLQSSTYQRLSEFENARQTALRTISISKRIGDYKTLTHAFRILGSVAFFKGEYESALEMYEKGLEYNRQLNDEKSRSSFLNNIGTVYHHLSDYARSMNYFNQSLEIQIEIGDKLGEASSYTNIGNVCYALGDYAGALDYHLKALNNYQTIDNEHGQSIAYSGIGLVYESLGDYQKAIESYQYCLKYEARSGNRYSYAIALNNLGNVYASVNDYHHALEAYQESLNIKRQILDRQGVAHSLNNIAELYIKQSKYSDALVALNESFETIKNLGDKSSQASCLITMARLFAQKEFEQCNLEKTIEYLNHAVDIAHEIRAKGVLSEAYQMLAQICEQKGDALDALNYYKCFHTIEQQIKSEESEKRIQSLSIAFGVEKAKKESELRRIEAEKYRLENIELVKANQFKTELLAIAAHDLKNPLQATMGFSQLIEESDTNERVKSFAKRIRFSSERMLSLIDMLLTDAKYETMNFEMKTKSVILSELIGQIIEGQFAILASQKSQVLNLEFEGGCVVEGDSELLKQIFENLISNAIKYSPMEKPIMVNIHRATMRNNSKQNAVRITVKDEGQGLTEEDMGKLFGKFQRLSAKPTGGETSAGLGLSIVKQLVALHKGDVWAESEGKGKGTTFVVELPETQIK